MGSTKISNNSLRFISLRSYLFGLVYTILAPVLRRVLGLDAAQILRGQGLLSTLTLLCPTLPDPFRSLVGESVTETLETIYVGEEGGIYTLESDSESFYLFPLYPSFHAKPCRTPQSTPGSGRTGIVRLRLIIAQLLGWLTMI